MEDNSKKMPHLYLDMDGVQADFFGAWAKRHGLNHYKEIAHPEDAINELAHSGPEEVYNFFGRKMESAAYEHPYEMAAYMLSKVNNLR